MWERRGSIKKKLSQPIKVVTQTLWLLWFLAFKNRNFPEAALKLRTHHGARSCLRSTLELFCTWLFAKKFNQPPRYHNLTQCVNAVLHSGSRETLTFEMETPSTVCPMCGTTGQFVSLYTDNLKAHAKWTEFHLNIDRNKQTKQRGRNFNIKLF